MRPEDITGPFPTDRSDGSSVLVWKYCPSDPDARKLHHLGTKGDRVIPLGPEAMGAIQPWLELASRERLPYVFSPAIAERLHNEVRMLDSDRAKRRRVPVRARPPKERYDRASYARAIARACKAAGVPHWSPNQLRHNRATELRAAYGLDTAGAVLGHSNLATTQVYAERDMAKAMQAAAASG